MDKTSASKVPAAIVRRAKSVLKTLPGKNWTYRIWENGGKWHVVWRNGPLVLHGEPGAWHTLLAGDPEAVRGYGELFWSPEEQTFETPRKAIMYQLQLARVHTINCQAAIDVVQNNTGINI